MSVRTSPAGFASLFPRGLVLGLAACCIVLGLAACGSTSEADDLPRDPEAREVAIGERLAQLDPRIGQDGEAKFLEVTITNPSDTRIETRCAPEWYDAKGAVVAAPSDWQRVDLAPGAEIRLRFAPMPASARSWRLRFAS